MKELVKQYHSEQLRNYKGPYLPAIIPYTDHLFGVKTVLLSAIKKTGEITDKQLIDDMCDTALGHDLLEQVQERLR